MKGKYTSLYLSFHIPKIILRTQPQEHCSISSTRIYNNTSRPTFITTHILLCARDDIGALDHVEEAALIWLIHSDAPVMVHKHPALLLFPG